jgi:hypothetical protein
MKSTTAPANQERTRGKPQKPWVKRTGPPLNPVSILLIATMVFLVAVMALASFACTKQSAVGTQSDEFTVGPSPSLKVETLAGRIEVTAGSDNVISVRAELRDIRRINYEAVQSGNEVIVTAEKIGKWWFPAGNTKADIYVTVPANTELRLETTDGAIEIRGTMAGGILDTSNGAIVLRDVKGDFDASTTNGAVDIDTIDGTALIKTSNGRVTVQEARGAFNLKTTNGNVTFSGELTPGGSSRLVTTNGRIEVELTGTPSIKIDASTTNGEIKHPDVPILTTKAKTDHVVGTIGAGEAELYIQTTNGDVNIK